MLFQSAQHIYASMVSKRLIELRFKTRATTYIENGHGTDSRCLLLTVTHSHSVTSCDHVFGGRGSPFVEPRVVGHGLRRARQQTRSPWRKHWTTRFKPPVCTGMYRCYSTTRTIPQRRFIRCLYWVGTQYLPYTALYRQEEENGSDPSSLPAARWWFQSFLKRDANIFEPSRHLTWSIASHHTIADLI